MTTLVPGEKQVPVTQSDSGSSSNEPSAQDQKGPNPFSDPATVQYWRDIYENAQYEGRHRFDPEFTWAQEEEKKLVRQVCAPLQGTGTVADLSTARLEDYTMGMAHVCIARSESQEHQSSDFRQYAEGAECVRPSPSTGAILTTLQK